MKRRITIEVISESESNVKFKVAKQTHREDDFCLAGHEYVASNKIILISIAYPWYPGDTDQLFVRGAVTSMDETEVEVPVCFFNRLKEAIAEYNKRDGGNGKIVHRHMKRSTRNKGTRPW
jgi:hypothetical protein